MYYLGKFSTVCGVACLLFAMSACSGENGSSLDPEPQPQPQPTEKLPINISTSVTTRATDEAFEENDAIGLFVVNNNADGTSVALKPTGNHVDNMKYTYNGTWVPATQTYWKDDVTKADFYLYYPYTSSVSSVEAMPFSVKADQSTAANYKAGDLLIGKVANVAPTQNAVKIDAKHVMSQMVIALVAGNGFTESTLAASQIKVTVNRLKTEATANLSTGAVTAKGDDANITPLKEEGNNYKAIVVPQAVEEGNLITVNVDGRDFNLAKASNFDAFAAGKKYKFTVTLSKTSNGVNVDITKWEDDGIDYGGKAE